MRILTITNQVPYPAISGAQVRTYNLLRRLARSNEMYLVAFSADDEQARGVPHLLEFCREVVTVEATSLREGMHVGTILGSVFRREPPELRSGFSENLALEIRKLAERVEFDIVQIEHGSMGMYLKALPIQLQRRAVWVLHDIDFDKFRQMARVERKTSRKVRARMHAAMMKHWQPNFASRFGLCVTMSEADRRMLLSANGSLQVDVSPNGVDTKQCSPLPDTGPDPEILFVGNMEYPPNVDAVVYFCRDVLPLVRNDVPDARLRIVGLNPGASVRSLEGNGVSVTGSVPDVIPYYRQARVCVVPLRAGSGTRLKVLEAMALGRPVISTSVGCEGLNVVHGRHILIADDSKLFAKQTAKLLTDPGLRARMAAEARKLAVTEYDWDTVAEGLIRTFAKLGLRSGIAADSVSRQADLCLLH